MPNAAIIITHPEVEGEFVYKIDYPEDQGIFAYEIMGILQSDMEDIDNAQIMGEMVEQMFAEGDASLDPAKIYNAKQVKKIQKLTAERASDETLTVEAAVKAELTPGVEVTVGLSYTWPNGAGSYALRALPKCFTDKQRGRLASSLASSGDGSLMQRILANTARDEMDDIDSDYY